MSNTLAALFQTVAKVTETYAQTHPGKPKKKKGPGCTPCAANARVIAAKARAGFGPG